MFANSCRIVLITVLKSMAFGCEELGIKEVIIMTGRLSILK